MFFTLSGRKTFHIEANYPRGPAETVMTFNCFCLLFMKNPPQKHELVDFSPPQAFALSSHDIHCSECYCANERIWVWWPLTVLLGLWEKLQTLLKMKTCSLNLSVCYISLLVIGSITFQLVFLFLLHTFINVYGFSQLFINNLGYSTQSLAFCMIIHSIA